MIKEVLTFLVEDIVHLLILFSEMFGLQGPEAYAYTSLSNCLDVQDIDDVKDYSDTIVRIVYDLLCWYY